MTCQNFFYFLYISIYTFKFKKLAIGAKKFEKSVKKNPRKMHFFLGCHTTFIVIKYTCELCL